MSVSSQERPLEAILPTYDKRRMRPERKEQSSNQKSRGTKTRNQVTLYSEKHPSKSGKIPLEPLKKATKSKTRNDAMMIDDVQHIENVSDYECTEARSLATDTDKKFSMQTPTYQVKREQQSYSRGTNNQSPSGQNNRSGYPPFAASSVGNSSKNNRSNKFESAAARYKA